MKYAGHSKAVGTYRECCHISKGENTLIKIMKPCPFLYIFEMLVIFKITRTFTNIGQKLNALERAQVFAMATRLSDRYASNILYSCSST